MKAISSLYRKLLYWRRLSKLQFENSYELRRKQQTKLKNIIEFAYNKSDFYREKAAIHGLDINNMNFPKDLYRLPFIERKDIQEHTDRIIVKDLDKDKLISNRTSGSTGSPLKVYMDQRALDYNHALLLYLFWELGFRPWHRCTVVTGVESKRQAWWRAALSLVRREISTLKCMPDNLYKLIKSPPNFVYGFPSYIELIARELVENGKHLKKITTVCHGETLYNWQRETMKKAFGERVFNTYGCTEIYLISFECEAHKGMHLITDAVYMELLDDNGIAVKPGEEGNVVITILNNYAMPLIRYKVGDTAIKIEEEPCSCGRNWPMIIKDISGRKDDYFLNPKGQRVSPKSLDHNVFYNTRIRQFQVIQRDIDKIDILIVKGKNFDTTLEGALRDAREQIKKIMDGEQIDVQIQYVEEIPLQNSGKFKTFVSMPYSPGIDTPT